MLFVCVKEAYLWKWFAGPLSSTIPHSLLTESCFKLLLLSLLYALFCPAILFIIIVTSVLQKIDTRLRLLSKWMNQPWGLEIKCKCCHCSPTQWSMNATEAKAQSRDPDNPLCAFPHLTHHVPWAHDDDMSHSGLCSPLACPFPSCPAAPQPSLLFLPCLFRGGECTEGQSKTLASSQVWFLVATVHLWSCLQDWILACLLACREWAHYCIILYRMFINDECLYFVHNLGTW